MNNIEEEDHRLFLARPKKNDHSSSLDKNIFASLRATQPLPKVEKIKGKQYDVVGPRQFRKKILATSEAERPKEEQQVENDQFNQTMNSTINRQTILSKMTNHQINAANRETKHINRYKEFQSKWDQESKKLRKLSQRSEKDKTLLERNVHELYVHPNHDKIAVLNDFVVHYWEMSLRNNNRILERHIRGHRFGRVQLEELMQLDKGVEKVERSIPKLPLDKLKGVNKKELSVTGRSKAMGETQGTGFFSARTKMNNTAQEEVFKVNYDGNTTWMATEGL